MLLGKEQLAELTNRVQERIDEFGSTAQHMPQLSPGVIRLVVDVLMEWQNSQATHTSGFELVRAEDGRVVERVPWKDCTAPEPEPMTVEEAVSTFANYQTVLSERAAAALGPEHTNVTPIKDSHLPTKEQLIAEVRRQAMGGVMPTMQAFDMAKPAKWASASAHMHRLGITWNQLAEEAGLKPNLRYGVKT